MTIRQLNRTQHPTTIQNPNSSPNTPKSIKNKRINKAPSIPHKFPSNPQPQQNQQNPYKIREIKMRARFKGSSRRNRNNRELMGFNKGMIDKDKRKIMWKMRQLQVMVKMLGMLDRNLLKSNTLWGQHRDSS